MKVTSKQLLDLLATKHSGDIFVPECKNGPTQTSRHLRLDAWVMPRSWAHWDTIGYEIKVSRGDFMRDEKWRAYLAYCHKFYFVAPPGIIDPKELPQDVGLLVSSKNGTRLYTKRRAAIRDVEIPMDILIYILMCRTSVRGEYGLNEMSKAEFWRNWLEKKKDLQDLGWNVSNRISTMIREEINDVRAQNDRLQKQIEGFAEVKKFCDVNNIPFGYSREYELQKIVDNESGADLAREIDHTVKTLQSFRDIIIKPPNGG